MKVEFKHTGLPKTDLELKESLEEIRSAVALGGEASEDVMKRVEQVVKDSVQSVERAKTAEITAKEALEIAKAAAQDRRAGSDEKIERQLKAMPMVYEVARDEDFSSRGISPGHFNLIQTPDDELRMALGDEAYGAAKRLRKLNDHLMTADVILRTQRSTRDSYERNGRMKGLKLWKAYEELAQVFHRALDTATTGGASEWAPTGYSAELMNDVRDQLAFARMFDFVPMPTNPWQYPILKTFMTSYLVGEATNDAQAATFTASDIGSDAALLTAYKHGAMTWLSREMDQDSIFPVIPRLNAEIAYALAFGQDKLVCNGQRAATIDAGDAPAASDVRKGGDGFRYGATLTGKTQDFGGTATVESFAALIGKIGKYADRCFFATGYAGLARTLILKDSGGSSVLLTLEKAGANATLFSGTVGILLGRPLVVSGVYPENMNAAGRVDGAGGSTKTGVHCVNPSMYLGGLRQSVEVEANYNVGWLADQIAIRGNARLALKTMITPSATYKFVAEGVNLAGF